MSFRAISRFCFLLLASVLAFGCAHDKKADSGERVAPPPVVAETPRQPVRMIPPAELVSSEAALESLKSRIRLVSLRVVTDPEETVPTRLAADLENLLANEEVLVEAAALFQDGDGNEVDRSEWTLVRIPPQSTHQFVAETGNKRATKAELLLRLAEEVPAP